MPTVEELQSQIDQIKKRIDEIPPFFGRRFTDALVSPNFSSGNSGWKIGENGEVEFSEGTFRGDLVIGDADGQHISVLGTQGFINFYSPDGTLQASIEGTDVATDGVDGLLIHTTDGAGYDYLLSSAGFAFPGGTFDGDITIANDYGINLGSDGIDPRVVIDIFERTSDQWELSLSMGLVLDSTDNVVTTKVPILINGSQYFLLATDDPTPASLSPSLSRSPSKSPSKSPSISPSKSSSVSPS